MLLTNSLKMKSKLKKKQTFLYKLLNRHFGIFLVIQEKRKITVKISIFSFKKIIFKKK